MSAPNSPPHWDLDAVITHPFDRAVSEMSARDFMARLKDHLGLSHLLIGYDFALGKDREGNAQTSHRTGTRTRTIPSQWWTRSATRAASSPRLRSANWSRWGAWTRPRTCLGAQYALSGPVIHGDGRGRRINIPTANIHYPELQTPARQWDLRLPRPPRRGPLCGRDQHRL